MQKKDDYLKELEHLFENYKFNHGKYATSKLMKNFINENITIDLNNIKLQELRPEKISTLTSIIVLTSKQNNSNKYYLNKELVYMAIKKLISKRIKHIKNKINRRVNHGIEKFKKPLAIGTLVALGFASIFSNSSKKEKAKDISNYTITSENPNLNSTPIPTTVIVTKSPIDKQKEKEVKKEKILNNYKKCKTLKDILNREEELKSLNLTKNDKIYPDCKLSAPLQRFIYEQSVVNNIPADFTFAIISTETRGNFNSSGEVSHNSNGSSDLGLTQQNTYSALKIFCERYNVNYNKAYELLKDDDFVNVASAFLEYEEIKIRKEKFNAEEYAGCYNGWLRWRNIKSSCEYVNIFNDTYNNDFTKHHKILKK